MANYTAEDPAFGGLMEHHTLRRDLARVTAERDRLAAALRTILDESGAVTFKRWDDYYAWVRNVADDALAPTEGTPK